MDDQKQNHVIGEFPRIPSKTSLIVPSRCHSKHWKLKYRFPSCSIGFSRNFCADTASSPCFGVIIHSTGFPATFSPLSLFLWYHPAPSRSMHISTSSCRFSYRLAPLQVFPTPIAEEVELYAQNKYDQKPVFGFHFSFNIYWLFLWRLHEELGYLGLEIVDEIRGESQEGPKGIVRCAIFFIIVGWNISHLKKTVITTSYFPLNYYYIY